MNLRTSLLAEISFKPSLRHWKTHWNCFKEILILQLLLWMMENSENYWDRTLKRARIIRALQMVNADLLLTNSKFKDVDLPLTCRTLRTDHLLINSKWIEVLLLINSKWIGVLLLINSKCKPVDLLLICSRILKTEVLLLTSNLAHRQTLRTLEIYLETLYLETRAEYDSEYLL